MIGNGPIPCPEKDPQTITFPSPYFKVFVRYLGSKLLFGGLTGQHFDDVKMVKMMVQYLRVNL